MRSLLSITAVAVALSQSPVHADGHLRGADLSAVYAAGVVTNFVHDINQPFDAWGMKYKSEDYRSFLLTSTIYFANHLFLRVCA